MGLPDTMSYQNPTLVFFLKKYFLLFFLYKKENNQRLNYSVLAKLLTFFVLKLILYGFCYCFSKTNEKKKMLNKILKTNPKLYEAKGQNS